MANTFRNLYKKVANNGNSSDYELAASVGVNGVALAVMGGASSSAAGSQGLVPKPAAGDQGKFLRGDGTWAADNNTWRGIQNNLTSDSSSDSLSAAQGKALANGSARDNTKLALTGGTMSGTLNFTSDKVSINFRPGNAGYHTTAVYQTSGNEALTFATKNAVTSFMFVNGEDSITNNSASRWTSITPGLQIKNNCISINKLIANGVTPSYTADINGTLNVSGDATLSSINSVSVGSSPKFTDTNTWRGIQNNLTSDSTTDSLTAAQGKALANGSARDSTKQSIRVNNSTYNPNAGVYVGGSGAKTYARILIPNQQTVWSMVYLVCSVRCNYTVSNGGMVIINAYHNATSPYTWTALNATVVGYLPKSTVVYASDGQYIYIKINSSYATFSVDKMLIGDGAVAYDCSNLTVDFVDTLPSTYQTATMMYSDTPGTLYQASQPESNEQNIGDFWVQVES